MAISPFADLIDELDYFNTHYFEDLGCQPHRHSHWGCHPSCCCRHCLKRNRCSAISMDKEGFQVTMNVQQFKPNEITVKTVDDRVVVEGRREEDKDIPACMPRHFIRKYPLPKGYDAGTVTSTLSSDGVLTVKAPAPSTPYSPTERIVEVQQTGPVYSSITEDNLDKEKKKDEARGDKVK